MARRLLQAGFVDGAVFHSYHAFECVLSAYIARSGYNVPPEGRIAQQGKGRLHYPSPSGGFDDPGAHKARLKLFGELGDPSKPYYSRYRAMMRYLSVDFRNKALYYDRTRRRLPQHEYTANFATLFLQEVHDFAREVRSEIH